MDIALYRNFIAIVEAGSLTKAAAELHMAQPALSHQLKVLQEAYGTCLIQTHQGQRHLEVTEAGWILYERAKHLLSLEQEIASDISASLAGRQGILRLTMSPSVSMRFISDYLVPFTRQNPGVAYDLQEVSVEVQAEQLLNGLAEIGIANAPLPQPEKFTVHLTIQDRMAIVFHQDSPWLKSSANNSTDPSGSNLVSHGSSQSASHENTIRSTKMAQKKEQPHI